MTFESLVRPVLLLAEQSESAGLLSNLTLWRVINLLIFVIILVYIFRNKIKIGQVFDSRAARITKELEQAKRDKQEAQERLAELEARLGRLDQEVAEMRANAQRESAREAERVRRAAEADADKIRQMTKREIEGAMRNARSELQGFVAEQSVAIAESIIRREIRPEDNARMVNKFIDELEGAGK